MGGRYQTISMIGSGGSSVVYEAVHHITQERVALKVIPLKRFKNTERTVARFMREAMLSQKINHEGIVKVYDAWIDDQVQCCLVMELLRGITFRDAIISKELSRLQALKIIMDMLLPLEAAHRADVIHRDLKPENIFIHHPNSDQQDTFVTTTPMYLDEDTGSLKPLIIESDLTDISKQEERFDASEMTVNDLMISKARIIKIVDFGLSRSSYDASLTQTGHFIGTPWYMSPEQVFNPKSCDYRTDLWSIGVLMYEILTDQLPFVAASIPEICIAITEKPFTPLTEIAPYLPQELINCVEKCLSKNSEDRPSSAAEINYQLDQIWPNLIALTELDERVQSESFPTPSTIASFDGATINDLSDQAEAQVDTDTVTPTSEYHFIDDELSELSGDLFSSVSENGESQASIVLSNQATLRLDAKRIDREELAILEEAKAEFQRHIAETLKPPITSGELNPPPPSLDESQGVAVNTSSLRQRVNHFPPEWIPHPPTALSTIDDRLEESPPSSNWRWVIWVLFILGLLIGFALQRLWVFDIW